MRIDLILAIHAFFICICSSFLRANIQIKIKDPKNDDTQTQEKLKKSLVILLEIRKGKIGASDETIDKGIKTSLK